MRVRPRASRSGLVAVAGDGVVVVRLASPPVDGRANEETVALLADLLDVRKIGVRIVSGGRCRTKVVAVEGLKSDEALARLRARLAG